MKNSLKRECVRKRRAAISATTRGRFNCDLGLLCTRHDSVWIRDPVYQTPLVIPRQSQAHIVG